MSRPGSPVLRLEGVTKTYGSGQDRLRVLDGVDLELRRGETTSMIGRSGSGKSTLIALAAGLLRPDAGRIHIGGQRTDELDDDARSSLPRCSRCCSRPIRRPSWPTRHRADELTGPVAGHSQNTQYHTGYILGEVLMSVRHALLALLSEGPKYGLQLRQEFESRTGEVWPLNVGQVYTTLQRLERDGLVESDDPAGDGPQKGFRITPAGDQELAEWLHTPPGTTAPPRDELVIKVLVAISVPGVDVHELVQVHRRHLVELMQHYTYVKAEAAEHDVGLALVVDAELFRLEAVVRWLDAADTRLTILPAASPMAAPAVLARRRHWLEARR